MKKATTKYQLERDGEQFGMIYNRVWEAKLAGDELVKSGFIKEYEIIPIKGIWLHCN